MRRAIIFLALLRGLSASAQAPKVSDIHDLITGTLSPSPVFARLAAFPEHLVYEVKWGVISVGHATMKAQRIVEFGSKPAYEIVSEARSNSFCNTFYKVRDLNESWMDAKTLNSLGYSKKLREGHFFRDEWVLFDESQRTYLAKTTHRDGNYSYQAGTIPVSVQDILSSLYFIRSKPLNVGSEVILDVNTKSNWPLVLRVIKKEAIKTDAGKFNTILVEPSLRQEGLFVQKGKRMRVWLSDDDKKIPVLIKVEIFFGHITISLSEML